MLNGHELSAAAKQLHTQHYHETSKMQRTVDLLTAAAGSPSFVVLVIGAILLWMISNISLGLLDIKAPDPPPFVWLQGAVSTTGLCVVFLILATQRRREQLTSHRDQLLLELAILNDQKVSKLIAIAEAMRRKTLVVNDSVDDEAYAMSSPSNTSLMLNALKKAP